MKQIEKNKEILWEDIERLCNQPITRSNAAELNTYMGALKAMCMICGEESEKTAAAYAEEKPARTPELDGDTEFEQVIMTIPTDRAHMVKLTDILANHMEQLAVVNRRAYDNIMLKLREVAKD